MTEETAYEVGYGRPPKHTQFKKGQSGNFRNRQKKNQSFAALIDKAFARRIPVRDGAERKHITILEAVTRQLVDSAARGDADALDLLMLLDQYAKKGNSHSPIIVEIVPDEPNPEK